MSRFQHLLIGNIPDTTFLYAPGSGMASFYAFVMAGVRHEPTGANGVAHLCEHLLFGGTERRWQKELFSAISQIGAFFNADTKRDYTCFHFAVPSENFAIALEILAEILFYPSFDIHKIETEKMVILEEIAIESRQDEYKPSLLFYKNLFSGSAYGMPSSGDPLIVPSISIEQIREFHRMYYFPENIKLLVMGDIQREKVEKFVEYFFTAKHAKDTKRADRNAKSEIYLTCALTSELKKNKNITDPRPFSPPINTSISPDLIIKNVKTERNYFYYALGAPGTDSPNFLPFNLFAEIIYTGGKTGMKNRLRNVLGRSFRDFSVTFFFWRDRGVLVFRLVTHMDVPPQIAFSLIGDILEETLKEPIPQSDLEEFLVGEELNQRLGEEKIDVFGRWSAQSFINMKFEDFAGYIENIKQITSKEIHNVAVSTLTAPLSFALAAGRLNHNTPA